MDGILVDSEVRALRAWREVAKKQQEIKKMHIYSQMEQYNTRTALHNCSLHANENSHNGCDHE